MSLLAARLLARRITTRGSTATAAASQQKRRMGAAAPAPEWTGIDKVVRGYFPQDDQRESTCVLLIMEDEEQACS